MKKALLIHGAKQTPVTVEETSDGGLVVHLNGKRWFSLEPVEATEELPLPPKPQQQEWIFKSGEDLPENIVPQDEPEITMSDLRPSTPENAEYNWRLIVRRFPWLFAKDYEYKNAVKYAEELANQKTVDNQPVKARGQLYQDLETIKPYLSEIIQDGRFVYGHQSVIARLLGGENHGGFRRNRILPVEAALLRSKLLTSATSANSTGENGKNHYFDLAQRSRQR